MAHISQSRPNFGLDFQVEVVEPFEVVPFSPGSGLTGQPSLTCLRTTSPFLLKTEIGCGEWYHIVYRGTSLITKRSPPKDPPMTLGIHCRPTVGS